MERHVFARKWSRRTMWIAGVSVALVLAVGIGLRARTTVTVAQVPFSDLLRHLGNGSVAEVVVNGDTLDFKLATGETFRTLSPANYVTANPAFIPDMAKRNVRIDVRT